MPHGIYTPLHVSFEPWTNISIDFVLELSRFKKERDTTFIVIHKFSKMAYFIACYKTDNDTHIVDLFFYEVVRFHEVLRTIIPYRNMEFPSHFWHILWEKLETKLLYSTIDHSQANVQSEVINRTLRTLLRAIVDKNLNTWENCFPFIEFA